MLVDKTGGCYIEGTSEKSIMVPYGGCGQVVIGANYCHICGVHVHFFCGDVIGEEVFEHMRWCPGC